MTKFEHPKNFIYTTSRKSIRGIFFTNTFTKMIRICWTTVEYYPPKNWKKFQKFQATCFLPKSFYDRSKSGIKNFRWNSRGTQYVHKLDLIWRRLGWISCVVEKKIVVEINFLLYLSIDRKRISIQVLLIQCKNAGGNAT